MVYNVEISEEAQEDLDEYISYLLFEKKSAQAAQNVLDDFETTVQSLELVAGSLKLCDNLRLRELGYKRIDFFHHDYFMLFRIEKDKAIVDSIFHTLQDYEHKMR